MSYVADFLISLFAKEAEPAQYSIRFETEEEAAEEIHAQALRDNAEVDAYASWCEGPVGNTQSLSDFSKNKIWMGFAIPLDQRPKLFKPELLVY